MKKIVKKKDSEINLRKLTYPKDQPRIHTILKEEQGGYCAYTEEWISEAFSVDIDHFDPNLKGTEEDNYGNWFLVSHKYNRNKSNKWSDFQPVLHPTASDLEERLIYEDGYYVLSRPDDVKADHLLRLLDLNNENLARDRKKYIEGMREISWYPNLEEFLKKHPQFSSFRRAIETEFGIKL